MSPNELIEAFHKEYMNDFPGIDLKEMKLICTAPFEMMRKTIQEGKFESVRLQYLFVLRVSPSRVMKHLKDIYLRKKANKISKEDFTKYKKIMLEHINSNPKKFRKYEQRIREITNS